MPAPAAVFPDFLSLRCGEQKLLCLNGDVTDRGCWPTRRRVYFWDTAACVDNVAKQKGGGEGRTDEWMHVFFSPTFIAFKRSDSAPFWMEAS